MQVIDSTHALVVYTDQSVVPNKSTSMVLTISGGTITAGAKYQPDTVQRSIYRLKNIYTDNSGNFLFMVLWDDGSYLHTEQILVSSNYLTITWSAEDSNTNLYITNKDQVWLFVINNGLTTNAIGYSAVYYLNDATPTIPTLFSFIEGTFEGLSNQKYVTTGIVPRGLSGLELSANTHLIFGADTNNSSYGTAMIYRMKNGQLFASNPLGNCRKCNQFLYSLNLFGYWTCFVYLV